MSKYNREAVEKEIKKSGVINRNQQVEASLVHRLLKGHQEELAPLAKNVKGAGQNSSSLRSEKNVKGAGQNNLFPWCA
mgnify:CR=1 FL=1